MMAMTPFSTTNRSKRDYFSEPMMKRRLKRDYFSEPMIWRDGDTAFFHDEPIKKGLFQ
jgi:hypothetical protein